MSDTTHETNLRRAALEFLGRAQELSKDFGEEVEASVRRAAEQELSDEEARRLYRRVLGILRTEEAPGLDTDERLRLAADIDAEVASLVSPPRVKAPDGTASALVSGPPELVSRRGLTVHAVAPTPEYNGVPVPMREGYVDVATIPLWKDNARVDLELEAYRRRNGRDPDPDELQRLMWGATGEDPFHLQGLADSVARRGVERPPIIDGNGVLRDGNRRVAASQYVLASDKHTENEKIRARWCRVWLAQDATDDQMDAVVVALNFESDHKVNWPEYVKARLVSKAYDEAVLEAGGARGAREQKIRQDIGKRFAITASDVLRYVRMMQWARDFEDYHLEAGRDESAVEFRSKDIFQWFYEMDAGKGQAKLTSQIAGDDDLRGMVYELMFDVLDSGLQVRNLHKVVAQEDALALLQKAHSSQTAGETKEALDLVKDAVAESLRRSPSRRGLAFDKFVDKVVDRFGATAVDDWMKLTPELRGQLRRVLLPALAAIEALDGDEDADPSAVTT